MNWLAMALKLASHLPVEKLFIKRQDPGKALEELRQTLDPASLAEPQTALETTTSEPLLNESATRKGEVSTEETIAYQRRELGKELLLLEKHLQQACKIGGKPCDCCEKHPITIEALAQETLGMTEDPVLNEIIQWAKDIAPITTEAASTSREYDSQYPGIAIKARDLRKRLMGTEKTESLLSPDLSERVSKKVKDIVSEVLDDEY